MNQTADLNEMAEYYFAYGNNMGGQTMLDRIGEGHFRYIALAHLEGYRISFTTETPEWGGPVLDLTPDQQGVVYGVLYEVDQCNGLQKQDTFLRHFPIKFPFKL